MPTTPSRPVALIAGGAGGMGRAIAEALARTGYAIALADLPLDPLYQGEQALSAAGHVVCAVPLDLRSRTSCYECIATTMAWGGRLDILINAAGVWREGAPESMSEADWDLVMDVNLKGPFLMIQAALPHLPDGAAILNIASDAGLVGNKGASVYSASKGGLVLLTKALALDLAPRRIRVNALCPADVATPMIEFQAETYGDGDPKAYKDRLLMQYPQGAAARFITPQEIASFAAYLVSAEASAITGAALPIDFGMTAGY